ncbi:MAG: hypothetical protein EOO93_07230, partial [Pedobacter sp.]
MKKRNFLISPKLIILMFAVICLSACIKNDNSIVGDSKVRIFNTIISDTSRNFYFNQALFNSVSGISALASSTNSSYFVVEAEKEYVIDARNSITGATTNSVKQTFALGKNYSIYYTVKNSLTTTKPEMIIYQDEVRQNNNFAQIMFINLGHTLGSKVSIKDKSGSIVETIGYGEKTTYKQISDVGMSKTSIILNLVDSAGVQDSISYTNFVKGKVYTVTNLNDAGAGSFREAFNAYPGEPLTIVFTVGGTIELQSQLKVNRSNFTIAGQTAPGDGICLKGHSFIINGARAANLGGNHGNIIIRYLRSRPGSTLSTGIYGFDLENCHNVIVDHCSFSWANEECAAMYDMEYVTVQYSIISEGLFNAGHAKGNRGYGGVWGGQYVSYHHNLFAHLNARSTRFNGARAHDVNALVDYRNNVIYNA